MKNSSLALFLLVASAVALTAPAFAQKADDAVRFRIQAGGRDLYKLAIPMPVGDKENAQTASAAKRACARAWSAKSAKSASATPSANGNAAERTIPAQTTANVRLDQRAVGPHSRPITTAKASAAVAIVATARSLIPRSAASG